jgi:hypothetical protein
MLLIQLVNLIDLAAKREQGADNGPGTCAEDEIEPFAQGASEHPLYLFQYPESVKVWGFAIPP